MNPGACCGRGRKRMVKTEKVGDGKSGRTEKTTFFGCIFLQLSLSFHFFFFPFFVYMLCVFILHPLGFVLIYSAISFGTKWTWASSLAPRPGSGWRNAR
jgi:hypothetical protein